MKELKDLKLMEKAKVSELTEAALIKEIKASEKKLFTLNMKLVSSELKQTHLVRFLKKYIARLKTVGNSKGYNIV